MSYIGNSFKYLLTKLNILMLLLLEGIIMLLQGLFNIRSCSFAVADTCEADNSPFSPMCIQSHGYSRENKLAYPI
jgi:hypothetical protein